MSPKSKKAGSTTKSMAIEEFDFISSVDLKALTTTVGNTDKVVYHGIYASQLYGTLFAIYGKFRIDNKRTTKNCCVLNGVNLRLLNYKGLLNVGFPKAKVDVDTTGSPIVIPFEIRGALTTSKMNINFTKPIEVNACIPKRIIFDRRLLALPGFVVAPQNKNDLSTLKSPKKAQIPSSPLFDTEFHYRDGVDYYDAILRDGMDGFDKEEDQVRKRGSEIFSYRCVQSNVNLVYY